MSAINDKVRHVKSARQNRMHACHWPGCAQQVPPAIWGCRPHWYSLPHPLRSAIWRAYRPGQENDMRPSEAYLEVARKVQEWIKSRDIQKREGENGNG